MNTQDALENYVSNIQDTLLKIEKGDESSQHLLEIIQKHINDESAHDKHLHHFYQGEHAFYKLDYELALRHYLQARGIPYFQFFCYRASAFVAKNMGNSEKAISLAKKALTIYSKDFITLKMLSTDLASSLSHEENEAFRQKIQSLKAEQKKPFDAFENLQKISLGSKELDELALIFNDNAAYDNILFEQEEIKTPSTSPQHILEPSLDLEPIKMRPMTAPPAPKDHIKEIHELKKLANSDFKIENDTTSKFIKEGLGVDVDAGLALEQKVKAFEKTRSELIKGYMEQGHKRSVLHDNFLYILNGWNSTSPHYFSDKKGSSSLPLLFSEQLRKASGGFYLRWNGKGIVINPGANFLEHFHRCGLHIRDIDHVIATRHTKETYADLKGIYDLNYQLNASSTDLHIIHYYLHHQAFQEIGRTLKPNFKQERHTIHSLELYLDSPESEKIEIETGIHLCYFATSSSRSYVSQNFSQEDRISKLPSSLGIRLELKPMTKTTYAKENIQIGYVSGTAWSPQLSNYLNNCDILISGFENTNADDFKKVKYQDDCLGYYGTYSLLEEVAPRLLLCCEFGNSNGDIRIEAIKKLRQEYAAQNRVKKQSSLVLPGDVGLYIDLKTVLIQCSVSKTLVDPSLIKVVKPAEAFGQLQYLSPACIL